MEERIRKTGIGILGDISSDAHICQFYHTKDDLIDIMVPYLKAGLESNEFCIWVTAEPLGVKDAEASLINAVKNLSGYIRKGQIEIVDASHWYAQPAESYSTEVSLRWSKKYSQAIERGFDGLRLADNKFWLEERDWRTLTIYEAELSNLIHTNRMIAICSYSLDKCGAHEVIDILGNHRLALIRQGGQWKVVEGRRYKIEEKASPESEENTRIIFDTIPEAITLSDLEGTIVHINEAGVKLHGYSHKEELIGRKPLDLIAEEDQVKARQFKRWILETGGPGQIELTFVTKDGKEFDAERSVTLLRDKDGNPTGIVSITRDITKRKQAEKQLARSREQLRNLSRHLVSLREEERGHISRELHDTLGQLLTALKMELLRLAAKIPKNQQLLIDRTTSMSKLLDTTIQAVKRISAELRPHLLDDLGLGTAIEWQAKEFQKITGMKCRVICYPKDIVLDNDLSTTIFRIFQESLTNVVRHANATEVKIRLTKKTKTLVLEVKDDGKGITKEDIADPEAYGLVGMRERAYFVGGTLQINGAPNKGTTVTLTIPLS